MKVILLSKMKKLGEIGNTVIVSNGYARNYLIPKKKAILATSENLKIFDKTLFSMEKKEFLEINKANNRIKKIQSLNPITFHVKVIGKNKIFGSIGLKDIIFKLYKLGCVIKKNEIQFPDGLMRYLGSYKIPFFPYKNLYTNIEILIVSEK